MSYTRKTMHKSKIALVAFTTMAILVGLVWFLGEDATRAYYGLKHLWFPNTVNEDSLAQPNENASEDCADRECQIRKSQEVQQEFDRYVKIQARKADVQDVQHAQKAVNDEIDAKIAALEAEKNEKNAGFNNRLEHLMDDIERLESESAFYQRMNTVTLRKTLREHKSPLAPYVDEIVQLDRWKDIVAIVLHETGGCTLGVGKSRNNCGAIKNGRTGEFKTYATVMDSLQDMAVLLERPHMKGKSISQLNGIYCVDEVQGSGPCVEWAVGVLAKLSALSI